jgi:hypothetical protein
MVPMIWINLPALTDFKAILSFDGREDALSRYCLVTTTYSFKIIGNNPEKGEVLHGLFGKSR